MSGLLDFQKEIEVVFRGRNALLTTYFDAACLLFDKYLPQPEWDDLKLLDDYYPGKYFLFFDHIPVSERKQIKHIDGSPVFINCYCESFLVGQETPKKLSEEGYIDIIGEDPLDYSKSFEFANPNIFAHAICKNCGKKFKVNIHHGYRVSYPVWNLE